MRVSGYTDEVTLLLHRGLTVERQGERQTNIREIILDCDLGYECGSSQGTSAGEGFPKEIMHRSIPKA